MAAHGRLSTLAALALAALAWIVVAVVAASGNREVRPSIDVGGMIGRVAQQTSGLEQALRAVVEALPTVVAQVKTTSATVLVPTPAGRQLPTQLTLVGAVLAGLLLASEAIGVWFRGRLRVRSGDPSDNPVFVLLLRDALAIVAMFAVAFVAVRLLFPTDAPLDRLAIAAVWGFLRWRVAVRLIDIVLRPGWPEARLLPASNGSAIAASRFASIALAIGIGFISIVPLLLGGGLSAPVARALALLVGFVEGAVALVGLRVLFAGDPRPERWVRIGLAAMVAGVTVIWFAAVLALEFSAYHAVVLCLEAIAAAYVLDRLLIVGAGSLVEAYAKAARRVIWLATTVGVFFGLARLMLVGLLHVFTPQAWTVIERGCTSAFLIIVVGFTLYEGLKAWATVKFADAHAVLTPGEEQTGKAISRFATVMPIALGFGGALILGVSVILALSELGVSVGPLIAGASIIGLAFSFGSQALVRDIVSGMFYMVDDAFRIGEYVDTGKHKGTVEKISLRSVRLRHQNGQFHNVAYGQFGAVTNFSRDWMTIKFNLRVAKSVEIERVRKLTKKLGQALLEEPEIGPEFLLPLKLQGLADIQENALVLRFKFTVRPTEPTIVRRTVMRRLFETFAENGIPFAEHAVTVRKADGVAIEDAAAAERRLLAVTPAVVPAM